MIKKRLVLLITLIMMFALTITVNAEETTKIGQATNGEHGKLRDCTAGDQSGGECSISKWSYGNGPYHWNYVFRAKDPKIAKNLAEDMKAICENNHIGYDQSSPDRYSLYEEAKKVGWDISAVKTNCETTCSSAVSVCLNAEGIKVSKIWYADIVKDDIMATGAFDCYTSSDYTRSAANLLPGDILLSSSHTAMVVESPNRFQWEVTYKDTEGQNQTYMVEDNSTIMLNPNNSQKPQELVIDDNINLIDYSPQKRPFRFCGWEKIDDATFIARYEGVLMLKTNNKLVAFE